MNLTLVALIVMTVVLGLAPRILKASPKADLIGQLGCQQAASCTPTPTPSPSSGE